MTDFRGMFKQIDRGDLAEEEHRLSIIQKGMKNIERLQADLSEKYKLLKETDPKLELQSLKSKFASADFHEQLDPENILVYVERWPLIVHIASAMICLGSSATFHLLQIYSKKTSDFLITLDYGGICFLIMGSGIPFIWYEFAC
mmetsp:Transcript_3457/g.5185  ORF Transcript_3457/g.5185 Transcript_3457/m.5185 type:complete len:144 (+) Transcript_3457:1640-2071(+)